MAEYIVLAIAASGFITTLALTPQTAHIKTASKKTAASQQQVQHKKVAKPAIVAITKPSATTQAVTTTPVSAPKPVVKSPAPSGVRTSTKVEPVVTPSPSSNVSGLTPTSTTSPSTSSSPPPSSSSPPPTTTSYTSTNWSGYLAATGNYTAISGSWVATNPTGNGWSTTADATWIGIGGVESADLIQIGTDNSVSASNQVFASAFYELLPGQSVDIPSLVITPGDSMTASIDEVSSGVWQMSLTDVTTGQTFSQQVSYNSSNSSAEWVEEDPSYASGQLVPFDNFGTANFSSASTVSSGATLDLNTANAQPITLVSQLGAPIAVPSSINADGASFDVVKSS